MMTRLLVLWSKMVFPLNILGIVFCSTCIYVFPAEYGDVFMWSAILFAIGAVANLLIKTKQS